MRVFGGLLGAAMCKFTWSRKPVYDFEDDGRGYIECIGEACLDICNIEHVHKELDEFMTIDLEYQVEVVR